MARIYALGSNGDGQLGFLHQDDIMVPQLTWEGISKVRKVVCGGNHSILLLDNGQVKCCGNNQMGQLLEKPLDVLEPGWHDVDASWQLDSPIKDIVCGWEFTLCITTSNTIYVRGNGPKGELGNGGVVNSNKFLKVLKFDKSLILKIASSFQNCCVLVNDSIQNTSRVFGWGSNLKCQLFTPKERKVAKPTILFESKFFNSDQLIDYVSMGKDFMIFVNNLGQVVKTQGNIPKDFPNLEYSSLKSLQVKSMWSSMHILNNNEKTRAVNSFGFGVHNQLLKDYPLGSIYKIVMGSEHGILVEKNSNHYIVKCWGWGEHGNCGPEDITKTTQIINDKANEKSKMNEIMKLNKNELEEIDIFGGCASTWIVIDEVS